MGTPVGKKTWFCRDFSRSTPSSTGVESPAGERLGGPHTAPSRSGFSKLTTRVEPVDNLRAAALVYTGSAPGEKGARSSFSLTTYREADLPAKRAPQEATARFPCPHVDAGRPGDPEATQGSGPQAALCLTQRNVHRRHRLSRSRDFDAVYRHGRSVSTRFLVLYWFPRDEEGTSRGSASPCRRAPAARPSARRSSGSCGKPGAPGSKRSRRHATTC